MRWSGVACGASRKYTGRYMRKPACTCSSDSCTSVTLAVSVARPLRAASSMARRRIGSDIMS